MNKFDHIGKFGNMESLNNENQLYIILLLNFYVSCSPNIYQVLTMSGPVQNSNNPKISLTLFHESFLGKVGFSAEFNHGRILTCEAVEKGILEETLSHVFLNLATL